jgi:threonine dehydratase
VYFDNWRASFVDGAGGKSVLETMWPLLSANAGYIVVSLDEVVRAMKLVAERTHVIAEGAAGCAIAAALGGRAGTGKVVAVVSGGNIDLSRFASLVGACDAAQSSIVNHQ